MASEIQKDIDKLREELAGPLAHNPRAYNLVHTLIDAIEDAAKALEDGGGTHGE